MRKQVQSKWYAKAGCAPLIAAFAAVLVVVLTAGPAAARRRRCRHDRDCDGLTNRQERRLGTSPRKADTDHDGISDAEEVDKLGTDPTVADTDGDGIPDGEEVAKGTDPRATDTDHDGIDDADDPDPEGELEAKLSGPLDSVDAAAKTISMFGCLTIDVSTAELQHGLSLADLAAGMVVEVKLDDSQLPALVAKSVELKDADHDGRPDDHGNDGEGQHGEGGSDGHGSHEGD